MAGNPIRITDPRDERVRDYFSLTDVALRRLLEPERGLFLAESEKVIRRALAAGHRPRSFLMGERWLTDLADIVDGALADDVPVYVAEAEVIQAMTGFHLHRGALAAMHRPALRDYRDLLPGRGSVAGPRSTGRSRIAVLEGLVDHTNVGAVFRSAAAMGVDGVLVTPRCADPLYRRSIRVSMGTVFQVPWTRIDPWPGGLEVMKESGYVVAGMTLADDAITLDELAAQEHPKVALVFGTEGHGLSGQADRMLDVRVRIPMAGGVDSLNVAASSAVAFYAMR